MTTKAYPLAPIAILIFNRPHHLRRMIESLQRCEDFIESPVVVFGDGQRCESDNVAV